ncbi:MAG TPA: CbrC family protein [Anaeromyxobacter sp.]|nr:CbrC family protein [Anaeromyxobacter sp.]
MANPIPTYRYFRNPRAEVVSTWQDEPAACDLCGEEGPGYAGPYRGEGDADFVCEPCLLAGKLGDADLSTNEGDVGTLREQLAHLAVPERDRLVRERTDELSHRTPGLVTWQELFWPACCGDYARFEGEVGREELDGLAGGGDGWRWFVEHVREPLPDGFGPEDLPPHASRPGKQWSLVVYHFRCTSCGKSLLHWDCD